MATDELTNISYTCGGSKSTVLVAEWYGTWEKLVLHGLALVTMEEVKINRFLSKFVVLFIIACYCMSQEFSVQHMT